VRLPALPHPEIERVEATVPVVITRNGEPKNIMVGVSSPLQTVFECLTPARRYPQKQLRDAELARLIEQLSTRDRARALSFAERNNLAAEYDRFTQLLRGANALMSEAPRSREFQLFF